VSAGVDHLKKFIQPFGISLEAEDSWARTAIDATAMSLQKARIAMADNVNVALCGDGTGLLANVLSGAALSWVLGTGTAGVGVDWDKLYVGQVVDVLTKANGVDAGGVQRRKITAINIDMGAVTFYTPPDRTVARATSLPGGSVCRRFLRQRAQGRVQATKASPFEGVNLATYHSSPGRGGP
jgi:hypothetical protein